MSLLERGSIAGSVASHVLSIAEAVGILGNDPMLVSSDWEEDYEERRLTRILSKVH